MNEKIIWLVEDLFIDIPYSTGIKEIKGKTSEALDLEYSREVETHTETQAFGIIVYKYGTLLSAGKLAGYSEEEIAQWSSEENVIHKKELIKQFRVQKLHCSLMALMVSAFLLILINFFIYKDAIMFALLCVIFSLFFIINKKQKILKYGFTQCAYEEYTNLSDRYAKRHINTVFLAILSSAYFILTVFIVVYMSSYSLSEAISIILPNSYIYIIVVFVIIRNSMLSKWLHLFCLSDKICDIKKHEKKILILSSIYWFITFLIFFAIKDSAQWFFCLYTISMILYVCGSFYYNLHFRKGIVTRNIVVNKKRIAVIAVLVLLVSLIQIMKKDNWILQPYISTIPRVEHTIDQIEYDDETGVYSIVTDKKDFKILQLTDIHLGGSAMSASKDLKALSAVYKLIEYERPDFIVVTGDLVFPMIIFSYSLNNQTPIVQFTNFMRNIGIPWAFVYGNHDTESMATGSPEVINDIFESASFKTSGTLLYPYIQPKITGRNNQMILVKNSDGSLRQALFLMDSNDYVGDKLNDYDYIHDDQVEWYKTNVEKIKTQYGENASSLLFFHMPLQEYNTAYQFYESNSSEVKYYFGENGETMIDKVCSSKYHSKIFDVAVNLGSTKGMFCGHDHYNNLSVEYKGIRLTYGMSIDYLAMPEIDKDTKQRGATLITLDDKSQLDIQQVRLSDIP